MPGLTRVASTVDDAVVGAGRPAVFRPVASIGGGTVPARTAEPVGPARPAVGVWAREPSPRRAAGTGSGVARPQDAGRRRRAPEYARRVFALTEGLHEPAGGRRRTIGRDWNAREGPPPGDRSPSHLTFPRGSPHGAPGQSLPSRSFYRRLLDALRNAARLSGRGARRTSTPGPACAGRRSRSASSMASTRSSLPRSATSWPPTE